MIKLNSIILSTIGRNVTNIGYIVFVGNEGFIVSWDDGSGGLPWGVQHPLSEAVVYTSIFE